MTEWEPGQGRAKQGRLLIWFQVPSRGGVVIQGINEPLENKYFKILFYVLGYSVIINIEENVSPIVCNSLKIRMLVAEEQKGIGSND